MNMFMWIVAGGLAGLLAYTVLKANEGRGLIASIIIGVIGGLLGGRELAPMFGAVLAEASDFNPFALFVALATAAACLTIANVVHKRYGV